VSATCCGAGWPACPSRPTPSCWSPPWPGEFDLDLVEAVTGLDQEPALDAVEAAVVAGLVVEDPEVVGRYRFAHALVEETIYEQISRARRVRLHARMGEALPHVLAAADHAVARLAYEQAEQQLRRALELLEVMAPSAEQARTRLKVTVRLGDVLSQLGGEGIREAATAFAGAAELAPDVANWEFFRLTDNPSRTAYDVLTEVTDPDLVHLQLDLFWATRSARDPVDLIRQNKGRVLQYHVKDMNQAGSFADPGQGLLDFARIFGHSDTAGVREYIVERDDAGTPPREPADALDTARVGYQFLRTVRF
jgi:hypothetical protein